MLCRVCSPVLSLSWIEHSLIVAPALAQRWLWSQRIYSTASSSKPLLLRWARRNIRPAVWFMFLVLAACKTLAFPGLCAQRAQRCKAWRARLPCAVKEARDTAAAIAAGLCSRTLLTIRIQRQ